MNHFTLKFQSHQKTHSTDKFFCIHCNKGFRRNPSLSIHVRTVHLNERPFPCQDPSCTKTFKRKADAKVHYTEIHLGQLRLGCNHCNERFYSHKLRSQHMEVYHPKEYAEYREKYKFMRKEVRMQYGEGM